MPCVGIFTGNGGLGSRISAASLQNFSYLNWRAFLVKKRGSGLTRSSRELIEPVLWWFFGGFGGFGGSDGFSSTLLKFNFDKYGMWGFKWRRRERNHKEEAKGIIKIKILKTFLGKIEHTICDPNLLSVKYHVFYSRTRASTNFGRYPSNLLSSLLCLLLSWKRMRSIPENRIRLFQGG